MHYAAKVKKNPPTSVVYGIECGDFGMDQSHLANLEITGRHKLILLTGGATIAYGVMMIGIARVILIILQQGNIIESPKSLPTIQITS